MAAQRRDDGAVSATTAVPPGRWPPGFAATAADRAAVVVLSHLRGMTPGGLHELAWREGSASACLRAVRRGAATDGDRDIAGSVRPADVASAVERCGARVAMPGDPHYPVRLEDLPDPPVCLYVRGRPPPGTAETEGPAVAVVGARTCSPYGREVAEALGAGLSAVGVWVVSGAAIGIDGAAHRGALRRGGRTVAVLGSGIDQAYPRRHRGLLDGIARVGAVVSEYPPGTPAEPRRFPARNRIVAALGAGVVVVEGAGGSGSLITAEFASDLGRDVLAVPGPVTSPLSEAPHELIRDGATLVRGPDDVLAWLEVPVSGEGRAAGGHVGLRPDERRVLDAVSGSAVTADAVASAAGVPTSEALSALVALELRGLLRSVGGRYERTVG